MKRNIIDIYEGILGDVDDVLASGDTTIAEMAVMDIINTVYKLKAKTKLDIIPVKNDNGKYTVNATGDVAVKDRFIKTLVNDVFEWGTVDGNFSVWKCIRLTNLEGSPKSLTGNYNANSCPKLVSLEGAPKQTKDFYCVNCASLKTLEGSPERIIGDFNCSYCPALTTLEGLPDRIYGDFDCSNCKSLKSLKGLPSHVEGSLYLPKIDSLFDEVGTEIISKTHVKGRPCIVPIK